MRAHRHPAQPCPQCGYPFDAVTALYGAVAPGDGDVSMCLACGGLAVFVLGGRAVREPTPGELAEFWADQRVLAAHEAWTEAKARAATWPKGKPPPAP